MEHISGKVYPKSNRYIFSIFFSDLKSSENEANALVIGGFLYHAFYHQNSRHKNMFCGEMKTGIKNRKNIPGR